MTSLFVSNFLPLLDSLAEGFSLALSVLADAPELKVAGTRGILLIMGRSPLKQELIILKSQDWKQGFDDT
jgi:hypothetical protein